MSLVLWYHPLSSFCWKSLIGLYELGIPFEKKNVDLSNEGERAAFARVWPLAKFPVLRDEARNRTIPESTILLEWVDRDSKLIPRDREASIECRLRERIFDLHVHLPMQTIVGDRLRPADQKDALGVARARQQIETTYGIVEAQLGTSGWALGEDFGLVDCAAFPALFYANKVAPLGDRFPRIRAYLERLEKRPSVARVLEEAKPYFAMFPA